MSELEECCEEFEMAIKKEFIQKPGLILSYGSGRIGDQKIAKKHFIGDRYGWRAYINICPFCEEKK